MPITDYYVASDAMGSVTAILDEDGNVIERRSYDAFGEMTCMAPDGTQVTESPTGVDVGFQGQIRDADTGLYQMGYRWYTPSLGRWLSRDPIKLNGGNNLLMFANNSPSITKDAWGLANENEKKTPPISPINIGISIPNGTSNQNNTFDQIASQDAADWERNTSANEMFAFLKRKTKENCCIKKLTIAGHGWGPMAIQGPGIPGATLGTDGLYLTGIKHDESGASTSDLAIEINKKSIVFCKPCLIQIHSCRISAPFVVNLASITKCRVVAASASCLPNSVNPTLWDSVPGVWAENPKGGGGFTGFRQSKGGEKIEELSKTYDPLQNP